MSAPIPTGIALHRRSATLELTYDSGAYQLPAELLRVYSPSAEVRGHGPGQETLVTGKAQVAIDAIHPVGNYAIQLVFSDGHDSASSSGPLRWAPARPGDPTG